MSKKSEQPPPPQAMRRRASAAAQGGIDPTKINLNSLPKVSKSDEAVARITTCLAKNAMVKHLSDAYKKAVVDAMKEVTCTDRENVITQGELGDFWYVVEKGSFEVWKTYEGETEAKKVKDYAVGDGFGELALMFNQRRAASVVAAEPECVVWAVDQATFKAVRLPRLQLSHPPLALCDWCPVADVRMWVRHRS